MFPLVELLAEPLPKCVGARIPNPRPCRGLTPVGYEVMIHSREELVASSCHGLTPPYHVSFTGALHGLGIGPDLASKNQESSEEENRKLDPWVEKKEN
ncbi:hypothetical protein Hanom_Chr16g01428961 [Helianthus anomalus]